MSLTKVTFAMIQGALTNALDFGADPSGTTDSTTALQNAIDAADGGTLFIPAGQYKITSELNITTSTSIVGEFSKTIILLATQNQNGIVVGDGTLATRNAVNTINIANISFNPFAGVSAFASGSCIYVNYTFNTRIVDCVFYGKNTGGTNILYNGVVCSRAYEYYVTNCYFQGLKNYGHGTGGTTDAVADQSIDGRIDFCTFIDIDVSCVHFGDFCGGMTVNAPIMYSFTGTGITVDSFYDGGGSGINFFIFQPDIEVGTGSTGISAANGNTIQIIGGWIGATAPDFAVDIAATASGVQVCSASIQGAINVEGEVCQIVGCEISGLSPTASSGIIATTCQDLIIVGNRIRQWPTAGIEINGVCPRLQITGNSFRTNGINITGDAWTALDNPAKVTGNNGGVNFTLTAASALVLDHGRYYYQVTGGTAINSMTLMAAETRVVIQAGASSITINNGAAIYLKGAVNATVPAFTCIEFMATGTNWIELSRNF
jgi:hypothetical protein